MNMSISTITKEDAHLVWPIVARIAAKDLGFSEEILLHYRAILTDDELVRRSEDKRHLLLAARKDGEMAGVLIGMPPEGGVATIMWLIVSARCRGEGVGKSLFEAGCSHFRTMGCHKVKLTAPTIEAVHFYEKQGMVQEGFHPNHWWHLNFWSLGKVL